MTFQMASEESIVDDFVNLLLLLGLVDVYLQLLERHYGAVVCQGQPT